jgi:protein SCO1/2
VLVPASLFGIVKWVEDHHQRLPIYGKRDHRILDFKVFDQDKKSFTPASWDGKIVVVNVFFTHCPVVCPKMMRNLKSVQDLFANERDLLITSFTVDPERDSSQRLKDYMKTMSIEERNWSLVTGNKKAIYNLARTSLLLVATDGDGGQQDFIHSDRLVLIDKKKRIRGFYDGTRKEETDKLMRDVLRLKRER